VALSIGHGVGNRLWNEKADELGDVREEAKWELELRGESIKPIPRRKSSPLESPRTSGYLRSPSEGSSLIIVGCLFLSGESFEEGQCADTSLRRCQPLLLVCEP